MRSKACLLLLCILLLAGCAPLVRHEQPSGGSFLALTPEESVGQTFTGRYAGLAGVAVFLKPGSDSPQGELRFHLRLGPGESGELASAALPAETVSGPGFVKFSFSPLKSSSQADYFFQVELEGQGEALAGAAPGEVYLSGSAYQAQEPVDRQLTFRLVYDPALAAAGLLHEGLVWLKWLLAAVFVFVLPGWALFSALWPGWKPLHWAEKLGLAGGLSLALYPLLFLLTGLPGLRLGPGLAWAPPAAAAAYFIAWFFRTWRARKASPFHWRPRPCPEDLALAGLAALVIGVRFWVIRSLEVPLWGDSYQHTLMTQLLIDHRGLFSSWEPYAELQTFTYHFGFHSQAAVFHWVSGLDAPQAVLWTGQILNVLAVISLAPLAARLARSRWAAVIAILIAGLLAPVPMSYVNMGRYTQLAGQAILPAAAVIAWAVLDEKGRDWRRYLLAWILLAGLALTHYRVLIFIIPFFVAYLLLRRDRSERLSALVRTAWLGAGAGILFLPWVLHVYSGKILQILGAQVTTLPNQASSFAVEYNQLGNLFAYLPPWMWLLLLPVVGWGLWRRERNLAVVGLWWFLLFLITNPQWFNLPGAGAITNFALLLAAYIPVSLVLSAGAGWLLERPLGQEQRWQVANVQGWTVVLRRLPGWLGWALLVGVLAVGAAGARRRLGEITPYQSALATRPDLRAAAWIQANTPPDARFLVNSFPAYGGSSVVGSDAGWWLPLLARRRTTLPPLTYSAEQGPRPDYQAWVNRLTLEINDKGVTDPAVLAELRARGAGYVYLGQRQGRVNNTGAVIEAQDLLADPQFEPVYHQDRVWIFRLRP